VVFDFAHRAYFSYVNNCNMKLFEWLGSVVQRLSGIKDARSGDKWLHRCAASSGFSSSGPCITKYARARSEQMKWIMDLQPRNVIESIAENCHVPAYSRARASWNNQSIGMKQWMNPSWRWRRDMALWHNLHSSKYEIRSFCRDQYERKIPRLKVWEEIETRFGTTPAWSNGW
jgi:hypothetical protein